MTHADVDPRKALARPRVALLTLIALWALGAAQAQSCPGVDSSGVYVLSTPAHLEALRDTADATCLAASYQLGADIALTGVWTKGIGSKAAEFRGTFDGAGFTISGLVLQSNAGTALAISAGLFAATYSESAAAPVTISNLTLENPSVWSNVPLTDGAGSLIGLAKNAVVVQNVTVTDPVVKGSNRFGGLIGESLSGATLSNVTVAGALLEASSTSNGDYVGGLFGSARGATLNGVTVTGDVQGRRYVGGVLGYASNITATDVAFDGTVTARQQTFVGNSTGGTQVGGIVGWFENDGSFTDVRVGLAGPGTIIEAQRSTETSFQGPGTVTGGFIGWADALTATITGIQVEATVRAVPNDTGATCESPNCRMPGIVGGLFGNLQVTTSLSISDASFTGDVLANGSTVGGFAADLRQDAGDLSIGQITIEDATIGGLGMRTQRSYVGGLIGDAAFAGDENGGSASITGITLTNVRIEGDGYVGGLIGSAEIHTLTPALIVSDVAITGITLIADSSGSGGAIGYLDLDGTGLPTLDMSGVQITGSLTGDNEFGGLLGYVDLDDDEGTVIIDDVSVTASVTSESDSVGGLIGAIYTNFAISNASYEGDVTGSEYVGGLIGYAEADSYAAGDSSIVSTTVSGSIDNTSDDTGGFIGYLYFSYEDSTFLIQNSSVDGTVTSDGESVGGLIGYVESYALIDVESTTVTADVGAAQRTTYYVGGFLGEVYANVTIDASTFEGDVIGQQYVGGLVGYTEADYYLAGSTSITGTTVKGTMTSSDDSAGGFLGYVELDDEASDVRIETSSFEGTVTSRSGSTGGVIGYATSYGTIVIDQVSVDGDISFAEDYDSLGGFIGELYGLFTISDSTFTGTVDGEGNYVGGLIGYAEPDDNVVGWSRITGTTIDAVITTLDGYSGGFIGYADFDDPASELVIESSSFQGSVTDDGNYVGGVFGQIDGELGGTYTLTDVVVTAPIRGAGYVGGVLGYATNLDVVGWTASNVDVQADGDVVGGLIAYLEGGSVTASSASGSVTGENRVGGLVGSLRDASVMQSFATTTVTGQANVGGLIGLVNIGFTDNVKTSFASGAVSGEEAVGGLIGDFVGGFVGDVYAVGAVSALGSGVNDAFGGLIGRISGTNQATLRHSFAVGAVSGASGSTNVGGLVGAIGGTWAVDPDLNFWDVDATGVAGTAEDRGTGLDTDALRSFATFEGAGWAIVPDAAPEEFSDSEVDGFLIWVLCDDPNPAGGYPRLAWEEERASCAPGVIVDLRVLTAPVLQGEPFDLLLTFEDADGNAVAVPASTDVTLSAVGGDPDGVLRRLGLPFTVPTARVFEGDTGATIRDLVFTGSSLASNDVTLTVVSDDGAFAPATVSFTVTRPVLTLTVEPEDLTADGGVATIRARYRDDLGARVPSAELLVSVSSGTLLGADDGELGSSATLVTDAGGDASVRWRVGVVPGDAVVSVACRGACRAEATVDLDAVTPDAVTGVVVTGENERLVVAFELPTNVTVRDVEYSVWPVTGSPSTTWVSAGVTMSPLAITGLTNGVTYAVRVRAIADAPNAAPGVASEVAEGTPTWPPLGIQLTTDVSFVAADGADSDVVGRLTLSGGAPAVNVPLDVTATAAVLLDGGAVTDAISVTSDEDGVVTFGLRAPTTPGIVTVTISCPAVDCTTSFTVEFVSTLADAPVNLLAIAGNRKIWLVFDEPTGNVVGYQYRIDEGAWIDVPEDAVQPYLILEVANGVEVDVMVRAVTSDGSTAPSNMVSVTPNPVGEPEADVGVDTPDVPLDVPLVSGVALLTVPFVFVNEGDAELTSVWLSEVGLREGERLIAISSDVGVITQYGARWFWRDFVLAPGGSIPGTLTIEIEERP